MMGAVERKTNEELVHGGEYLKLFFCKAIPFVCERRGRAALIILACAAFNEKKPRQVQ